MYISNLVVDSVTKKLPELYNCVGYNDGELEKVVKKEEDYTDGDWPMESVYWPIDQVGPRAAGLRGAGAYAVVFGAGSALLVKLKTGVKYPSFVEKKYLKGMVKAVPVSGSVVSDMRGRSFWPNVADNIYAPRIGRGTEAEFEEFVGKGRACEGVAARVVALALEHALVPFVNRTRIRNAAASYWCLGRYRSDNITFSIQNAQAALTWASPNLVGEENGPKAVVWVGDASKVRGMALLSRLYDAGGPMHQEKAHLLDQFEEGKLLMVGTGALIRELRPVQPNDLFDAINEALWILIKLNNVTVDFVENALRLMIRNLPVVDTGYFKERAPTFWRVREREIGDPELHGGRRRQVLDAVRDNFGRDGIEALGFTNQVILGCFSDVLRREALAPDDGVDGFAPPTVHSIGRAAANFVAGLRVAHNVGLRGENVAFARFDVNAPPAIGMMAPQMRNAFDQVMPVLSGRAAFRLFAVSAPGVGGDPPALMPGFQVVADPGLVGIVRLVGVVGGDYQEWVGGHNADGLALTIPLDLRHYVVRMWLPVVSEQYVEYEAPPGRLRRFDVPADMRIAVRMNGELPDIEANAPRVHAYLSEVDLHDGPLQYMQPDGMRALHGLSVAQRTAALLCGVAYCWDAAHIGETQNDAHRRWVDEFRAETVLTDVPDELTLFMGGIRAHKYIEPAGGLWILCYLKQVHEIDGVLPCTPMMHVLRNNEMLSAYIMKYRAIVEVVDQLMRVSNSSLVNCRNGIALPMELDNRNERAKLSGHTIMDGATYLMRQALFMDVLFSHPECLSVRNFGLHGGGNFRVLDPAGIAPFDGDALRYLNWVTPQTLNTSYWNYSLGIASPSFILDRMGRGMLYDAHFTTKWNGVDDSFESGIMLDRDDEIWCAILTSSFGYDWDIQTMILAAFGQSFEVYVGSVRIFSNEYFTPFQCRLCLPYETRIGSVAVPGLNMDNDVRPSLDACPVVREINRRVVTTTGIYGGNGIYAPGAIVAPLDRPTSLIDLRSTVFASNGFNLRAIDYNEVVSGSVPTYLDAGVFWMGTATVSGSIIKGMCPGAQRILQRVTPSMEGRAGGDGTGPATASTTMGGTAPDVTKLKDETSEGIGDIRLREVSLTEADTLMSTISGMTAESLETIMEAILRAKMGKLKKTDGTETTAGSSGGNM